MKGLGPRMVSARVRRRGHKRRSKWRQGRRFSPYAGSLESTWRASTDGAGNWKHSLVESFHSLFWDELLNREQFWISTEATTNSGRAANLTSIPGFGQARRSSLPFGRDGQLASSENNTNDPSRPALGLVRKMDPLRGGSR